MFQCTRISYHLLCPLVSFDFNGNQRKSYCWVCFHGPYPITTILIPKVPVVRRKVMSLGKLVFRPFKTTFSDLEEFVNAALAGQKRQNLIVTSLSTVSACSQFQILACWLSCTEESKTLRPCSFFS